jgi:hypothetical protein
MVRTSAKRSPTSVAARRAILEVNLLPRKMAAKSSTKVYRQPRRHVFRANPHATVPRDLPLLRHGPVFQPSPTQPSAACFWAGRHANTESLKFPFFRASGHCFGPLPQGRRYPSPLPRWPKKPAPIGPPRMTASSTLNRSPIIARPCLSATAPTAPIASQSGR